MTEHPDPRELEQRFQHLLQIERALTEERWNGWRALDAAAWRLADTRLEAIARLHEASALTLDRRLTELDEAQAVIEKMLHERLRVEVYAKDMERLYAERQAHNATAAQARIQAENAAATNRRNTAMALLTSGITVLLSIALHFLPSHG